MAAASPKLPLTELTTNSLPHGPARGTVWLKATMGWDRNFDAGQAAMGRGSRTRWCGTGNRGGQRAASGMPGNTQGVGRRREGPGNEAEAENINTRHVWTKAEMRTTNSQLQSPLTGADRKPRLVYSDTIHQNSSTHLAGGDADHRRWQRLY